MAGKIISTTEGALNLLVSVVGNGAVRVKITENQERYAPNTLLLPVPTSPGVWNDQGGRGYPSQALRGLPHAELIAISFGDDSDSVLAIHPITLKFELYHKGLLQASANGRSRMHFEQAGVNMEAGN